MRHRVPTSAAVALAVAAITVPVAHAANSDAGNKSDYPELFSHATDIDDGYKSGYPQLHAIHTYKAWASRTAGSDDDSTSGYPQLHAHASGPPASQIQSTDRAFHWSDAALGAGTAALRPSLLLPAPSHSAATEGSPFEPGPPLGEGSGVRATSVRRGGTPPRDDDGDEALSRGVACLVKGLASRADHPD